MSGIAQSVTVAIPTRNRRRCVIETLESLLPQLCPSDALLIADDGSTDGTPEAVSAWLADRRPDGRLLQAGGRGVSVARNDLLAASRSSILCFLDDDVRPQAGWLDALRRAWTAAPETTAVIGGPLRPHWGAPRPAWLQDHLLYVIAVLDLGDAPLVLDQHAGHGYVWGGNMSVRADYVREVGGFDPREGPRPGSPRCRGEEEELQRRIAAQGWECRYQPDAAAVHLIPASKLDPSYFREAARLSARIDACGARPRARGVSRLLRSGMRHLLARARGDGADAVASSIGLAYGWALLTASRPATVAARNAD